MILPKRVRDYEEGLIEKLKDAEFAAEYLNASLEDGDEGADERCIAPYPKAEIQNYRRFEHYWMLWDFGSQWSKNKERRE